MRNLIHHSWKPMAGAVFLLIIAGAWLGLAGSGASGTDGEIVASEDRPAAPFEALESNEPWGVYIHSRSETPSVQTDLIGDDGRPVTVNCNTCHANREPNWETRSGDELHVFHQGLTKQHGDLTCLSCHNAGDYQTLRAADGRPIQFADSMKLCAQCHGIQYRDYLHGAHGGMSGYWSLDHGPRTRNHCLDCHDAHSPQFVGMQPAPPPRDRFLYPAEH